MSELRKQRDQFCDLARRQIVDQRHRLDRAEAALHNGQSGKAYLPSDLDLRSSDHLVATLAVAQTLIEAEAVERLREEQSLVNYQFTDKFDLADYRAFFLEVTSAAGTDESIPARESARIVKDWLSTLGGPGREA